jgi:uncharacterized protein YaaR (DUF327 family)
MEIKKLNSNKTIKEKMKSFKKSKAGAADVSVKQSPFFDKLLEVTQVKEVHMELDKLLEEIDATGKRFAREPEINNLQEYKSLIKAFMDTVIEKMFKVKEKTGPRSWVKQKVYITVDKINKKLEELTDFVLDKEKDNINLMATLDEIRGMMVDLYK